MSEPTRQSMYTVSRKVSSCKLTILVVQEHMSVEKTWGRARGLERPRNSEEEALNSGRKYKCRVLVRKDEQQNP